MAAAALFGKMRWYSYTARKVGTVKCTHTHTENERTEGGREAKVEGDMR